MIEFHVEGMTCQHCVSAITSAVRAVDAAAQVQIDLSEKSMRIASGKDIKTLAAAIDEAGYTVSTAKTITAQG